MDSPVSLFSMARSPWGHKLYSINCWKLNILSSVRRIFTYCVIINYYIHTDLKKDCMRRFLGMLWLFLTPPLYAGLPFLTVLEFQYKYRIILYTLFPLQCTLPHYLVSQSPPISQHPTSLRVFYTAGVSRGNIKEGKHGPLPSANVVRFIQKSDTRTVYQQELLQVLFLGKCCTWN